jgi:hypothetical protein
VHAPHGKGRRAGRQSFNRLIKPTHRKARGYPARMLSCVRSRYFLAYRSSASSEDPPTGFLVSASGRVTKRAWITTGSRWRQRTSTDGTSLVRQAAGPGSPRREMAPGRRCQ